MAPQHPLSPPGSSPGIAISPAVPVWSADEADAPSPRSIREAHPAAADRLGAYLHALGITDTVVRDEHIARLLKQVAAEHGELDDGQFTRDAVHVAVESVQRWVGSLIAASPFRDRAGGNAAHGLVLTRLRPLLRRNPRLLFAPAPGGAELRRAVHEAAAMVLPVQSRCQMKPQPLQTPGDGPGARRLRIRALGLVRRVPSLAEIPGVRRLTRFGNKA